MSLPTYPSLTEDGWITNPISISNYILSDFFLSDNSQDYVFNGNIASMAWCIHEGQGDVQDTAELIKIQLRNCFSRYFQSVEVSASDSTDEADPSVGKINLVILFTDHSGKAYNLAKLLEISDMKVRKIINILNGD